MENCKLLVANKIKKKKKKKKIFFYVEIFGFKVANFKKILSSKIFEL